MKWTRRRRARAVGAWRRQSTVTLVLSILAVAGAALSAPASARTPAAGQDGFRRLIFSPELVMRHQSEIGLTPEQKEILVSEMQSAQSELVPIQMEMAEAGERLGRLLAGVRVDEGPAVEAARRVMELESEVKTRHLLLVIRIKNLLSSEQQSMLRTLREAQK